MRLLAITLIATLPAIASAQSIYRCEINGRAVFQDRPCATAASQKITVRVPGAAAAAAPAGSLDADGQPLPEDSVPAAAPGATSADRTAALQRYTDGVVRDRERRRLSRIIGRLEVEREGLQQDMDRELARLKAEQGLANNNLAGATYLQSINTEMQAVTSSYSVRIANKDREIAEARAELAALDD
jgi:hypothetical protein